jgi:hypothetical protein
VVIQVVAARVIAATEAGVRVIAGTEATAVVGAVIVIATGLEGGETKSPRK